MAIKKYVAHDSPPQTIASASTTDIGSKECDVVTISGTTTITSLGTATGRTVTVVFSGALILTHNATTLILPGATNITTVAGDVGIFVSDASGNWRCVNYRRGTGQSLMAPLTTVHTTSGSHTLQTWCRWVEVQAMGGGGGGGSGRRGAAGGARSGGGGGGAPATVRLRLSAAEIGTGAITVTIGAGGAGGAAVTADDTSGNAGTAGGDSSYGDFALARGGTAGNAGTASAAAASTSAPGASTHNVASNQQGGASSITATAQSGFANGIGPGSGSGGGGITSGNASLDGNTGGIGYTVGNTAQQGTAGTAGTSAGNGGAGGAKAWTRGAGGGGGGGGGNSAGAGGTGGAGGLPGGAGGGGGASVNGSNSGAGGAGANGEVWITEFP